MIRVLFSRMCKALEHFVSLKTSTDLCKMQFRIKVQYSTSLMSLTCMLFNALHLYSVSLTSPT